MLKSPGACGVLGLVAPLSIERARSRGDPVKARSTEPQEPFFFYWLAGWLVGWKNGCCRGMPGGGSSSPFCSLRSRNSSSANQGAPPPLAYWLHAGGFVCASHGIRPKGWRARQRSTAAYGSHAVSNPIGCCRLLERLRLLEGREQRRHQERRPGISPVRGLARREVLLLLQHLVGAVKRKREQGFGGGGLQLPPRAGVHRLRRQRGDSGLRGNFVQWHLRFTFLLGLGKKH